MVDSSRAVALPGPRPGLALNSLEDIMRFALALKKASVFPDCESEHQALVKIVFGKELGFGPMASMSGVHLMEGKPVPGAHLMAALIRGSGRYDYKVHEATRENCDLEFFRLTAAGQWQSQGRIALSLKEAKEHGYHVSKKTGKELPTWRDRSHDMLFADVIRQGFRRHCPDLSFGVDIGGEGELEEAPPPRKVEVITPPAEPRPAAAPAITLHQPADNTDSGPHEPRGAFEESVGPVYVSTQQLDRIDALCRELKVSPQQVEKKCVEMRVDHFRQMTPAQADELEAALTRNLARKRGELPLAAAPAAPANGPYAEKA